MSIVFNFILLKILAKNFDLIYLGSSDDDSFAKVFQHEGKSWGRVGEGVRACFEKLKFASTVCVKFFIAVTFTRSQICLCETGNLTII